MDISINNQKLYTLNLTITEKCNLKCLHCGADNNCNSIKKSKNWIELSAKEYFKVLDEAKKIGCRHIIISGGEPFLNDDIWSILEKINKLNMSCAILTNGTLINKSVAKKLSTFPNISYVRISLDYKDNNLMEKFRGIKNLVNKVFEAVKVLNDFNVKSAIGMTIMPDNIDHIKPIAEMAKEAGVSFFRAIPIMPIGRAKNTVIDTDFYSKALIAMLKLAEEHQNYYLGTTFLPKNLKDASYEFIIQCPGGEKSIYLSAYGHLSRCPLTPVDFSKSTIREESFINLLKSQVEKKNIEKDIIINDKNHSCGNCKQKNKCYGGCLAECDARFNQIKPIQPICIKEVWEKALSQMDNTPRLRKTINNLLILNSTIKSSGTDFCYRSLPIWWIAYPQNLDVYTQ